MGEILDLEVLDERARNLGTLNGFRLVFVELLPAAAPTHAVLDVDFHNANELTNILNDINVAGDPPTSIFRVRGGTRILAGDTPGQVQVTAVTAGANPNQLRLRVEPIGDYSTYVLALVYNNVDPMFSEINFKFRAGCFNLNCAAVPEFKPLPAEPVIDYLAKDYDSFKHVLIAAMMQRVPGWTTTSEADLDQVLIDLIAADADELSDFQDRVKNEGYLGNARKRVSLARHARLMDYHIHQGNQATTWIALRVAADTVIPQGFGAWTGTDWDDPKAVIFAGQRQQSCFSLLNDLALYTWDDLVTALEAGSSQADLALPPPLNAGVEADANLLRDVLLSEEVKHLLIQEALNPDTGTVNGRDIQARQLLRLRDDIPAAESMQDPLSGDWFVRVFWHDEDQLKRRYCFVTRCVAPPIEDRVTLFHGNLVPVAHGRPHLSVFRPPGAVLAPPTNNAFIRTDELYYETTPQWGTLCTLQHGPVSYRNTTPGGELPPHSSIQVTVGGFLNAWEEQSDFIESEGGDEHFIVETDEYRISRVRTGDSINGRALPDNAVLTCTYQVGNGESGNVGADKLTGFDAVLHPNVTAIWNPFDVTDGRERESVDTIIRRVPEAFRVYQLRAVTLEDYVARAEELNGVAHAAARYAWTGSWRTVRVAIDPVGTTTLDENLRLQIHRHLDAVSLIGEDLEVRAARYVPLDILMRVCVHPHYWPADVEDVLMLEFSDGYTPDGRPGFFNPDLWTFGQPLYASQLIGRALTVTGVERILSMNIRRWQARHGPSLVTVTITPDELPGAVATKLEIDAFEVIQVANDPSHLELGRIQFDLLGGRQ